MVTPTIQGMIEYTFRFIDSSLRGGPAKRGRLIIGSASDVGPVHLLLGPVFGAPVDFLIVAWLVFWFSKKVLKEASVTKT